MKSRYLSIRLLFSILLLMLLALPVQAQEEIKKEVRVFQPYKPTLSDAFKLNFLPVVNDTLKFNPLINYEVTPKSFMPDYELLPISAARMLSDPLSKLYKGYVKLGMGNYTSPLAEVHIGSLRSRKSASGLHFGHHSSHGKVKLENEQKVFAGYSDTDAELFYSRFYRKATLKTSLFGDYKTRYAYGYDTGMGIFEADKDSIKHQFIHAGAAVRLNSVSMDSSDLAYDLNLKYQFFHKNDSLSEHAVSFKGRFGQEIGGFYAGADLHFDLYEGKAYTQAGMNSLIGLNPWVEKGTPDWRVHLGAGLWLDYLKGNSSAYFIPDVWFRFDVIPSWINFRLGLDGEVNRNNVAGLYAANSYLQLYRKEIGTTPSSVDKLRVYGAFTGSLSPMVTYALQASYALFEDELFITSYRYASDISIPFSLNRGNSLNFATDEGELFQLKGELNSRFNDRFSLALKAEVNNYTVSNLEKPWGRIPWQGEAEITYDLRQKIIFKAGLMLIGERDVLSVAEQEGGLPIAETAGQLDTYLSANMSLEYRYSKVLSAWIKAYNLSNQPWYEYPFYASQRFLFMAGLTYSL